MQNKMMVEKAGANPAKKHNCVKGFEKIEHGLHGCSIKRFFVHSDSTARPSRYLKLAAGMPASPNLDKSILV